MRAWGWRLVGGWIALWHAPLPVGWQRCSSCAWPLPVAHLRWICDDEGRAICRLCRVCAPWLFRIPGAA